ncbi:MAG: hypothetical protein ACQESR_06110 [Planctomycetota bacterium]
MSSGESKPTGERAAAQPSELRVTNWPLRDAPLECATVYLGSLLIAGGAGLMSRSVSMGLLTLLTLLLVFWKLWIPITVKFDSQGIMLTVWRWRRRIPWRHIDHLELHEAGMFLCPQSQPAHRVPLQSFFVPWRQKRNDIPLFCRRYRPVVLHEPSSASGTPSP